MNDIKIISTSDVATFSNCKLKWDFSSHLRSGYRAKQQIAPFWLGSLIHFILEDLHGYNRYSTINACINDYVQATKQHYTVLNIPEDYVDLAKLALSMMDHYKNCWLAERNELKTYVLKNIPQVEVPISIEIEPGIVFKGILDRVIIDNLGHLWIVDYKTCKQFANYLNLSLDRQIGFYLWAAQQHYKKPVVGFIYHEFKKIEVSPPKLTMTKGGGVTTNAKIITTARLYREACLKQYGSINDTPDKNISILESISRNEDKNKDAYIKRTHITRNKLSIKNEGRILKLLIKDMFNDNLNIYPNYTRDCAWCQFVNICIDWRENRDFTQLLRSDFEKIDYKDRSSWTQHTNMEGIRSKENK